MSANIYKKGGIKALINLHYKGGQPKLNEKQLSELREQSEKGNFSIAKEAKEYIEKKFGVVYVECTLVCAQ